MCKRLLFLTSFVLALSLFGASIVSGHVLEIRIADDNDDAEQHLIENPRMDLGSSDLEIPYEDGGAPPTDLQAIGVRFVVDIGQGTALTSAHLELQADKADKEGTLEPVNVIIRGELSPDAAQFAGDVNNITDRPTTVASVAWSIEPYTEIGQRVQSPDLTPIIEEIINQEGWSVGNALVLIITDDPDNPSTGLRETEAGPGDDSATLVIEFGPPTDEIWREAEYPEVLGANWRILSDPTASGLKAIGSDNGDGNDNNTAPGADWVAVYNFTAAGGDYKIMFRGVEAGSDSFWVRITTATSQTLEDPDQPDTGWVRYNGFDAPDGMAWDEVHSNDHSNEVVIWTIPAGENTLEIAKREDGVYLDGFIITNNLDLNQDALPSSIDPPPIAGGPVPDDGAIELDPTVLTALAWTPPEVAVSSQVYLSADETIDDTDLLAETDQTTVDIAVDPGMTYLWRVDSVEADGTVNTGEVWGFATLPIEAHFPSPADGAVLVAINETLGWTAGLGALVHNVFFSTDQALVEARDPSVQVGQWLSEGAFDPGLLENSTTYYWAVDEFLGTATNQGPVWSFTTIEGLPILDDRLVAWYTFDKLNADDPDSLIIDWSGNSNTGTAMGDVANIMIVDDPVMGTALSLPGGDNNFVACGDVGISGNDPTTIACWAKADHTNIPNWTLIFGFTGQEDGSGGSGSHFNVGSLGGPGGVGAHVWGWEETIFSDEEALEWNHYAMTYDGTTIAYYGNGVLTDSEPEDVKTNVRDLSARADRVHIGSRITQGSSFPGDVDDCRVYNVVLGEAEILTLALQIGDVTGPDDVVVGVPDEPRDGSVAGWPDNEHPALALDDDAGTKFLHFRGDTAATGFKVTPALGSTVVTGLLLTTANDCAGRDPIAYEIYGSNEGIDGPYELIANGDVPDFAQETEWPRFTKNATPLVFENAMLYAHYQVLFPAIRGPVGDCVNSMQIAEVELLGTTLPVISSVVRSNGTSGDRDRIGAFDGSTAPMGMVEGGLANGAPIFSDRTYTWGGVPDEYVGTEYIATFNTDKNGGTTDVTYEVTITQPAIVWITVDDRIPAEWDGGGTITSPQDAADSVTAAFADPGTFTDTGIDLLVVGDNDRSMSVFAAELPAGTYVFGSMDSGKNFYSIGAVGQ